MQIKQAGDKGRGVFATQEYGRGQIIERSPVIVMLRTDILLHHKLAQYVFSWDDDHYALALGYGSLFNHSHRPNMSYLMVREKRLIYFRARNPIRVGEELSINYTGDPKSGYTIYFRKE